MSSANTDITRVLGSEKKTGKKRRWSIRLLLLVILIAAGMGVHAKLSRDKAQAGPRFVTQPAVQGDLIVQVTATGALEPTNEVEVGSELSGIVKSVVVEENDRVTVGQALAELDQAKFKAQVMQNKAALQNAQAKILQAKASVSEASSNLSRYKALHQLSGGKAPSKYDLEAAEAALLKARAEDRKSVV
mgnify:CR=1 FL=1